MTVDGWPDWLNEMRTAALGNIRDAAFISRTRAFKTALERDGHPFNVDAFVAWWSVSWRTRLPYRFDGTESQRTVSERRALRRGFAACGDAAAGACAVVELLGDAHAAEVCVETRTDKPRYAHVRVYWRGVTIDPYVAQSLPAHGCAARFRVSTFLDARTAPELARGLEGFALSF